MIRAYHFVGKTLRDGSPIPEDGEWLRLKGPISICRTGLHASRHVSDALQFAPAATLCLVDMSRDITEQKDKLVARCRRIVARFDATKLLRADARLSALSVLKYWEGEVPQSVMDWLTTGDEQYRIAAWSAARSASWGAARSAAESVAWSASRSAAESVAWGASRSASESVAWSAAWSEVRSAARSAARDRLQASVDAQFARLLK